MKPIQKSKNPFFNNCKGYPSYFCSQRKSVILKAAILVLSFSLASYFVRFAEERIYFEILLGFFFILVFALDQRREYLEKKLRRVEEYGLTPERYSSETVNNILYPSNYTDENYEIIAQSNSLNILGGDFYNHTIDKDGNYWFAIGDSCGHDLGSHLFSVLIMNCMNYYINICKTPKEVVEKINEELIKKKVIFYSSDRGEIEHYATIVVMKADSDGNVEHYGLHPNPVLLKAGSKGKEIIETTGIYVGVADDGKTQEPGKFKMGSGDLLFLFTDGIFEQKNKNRKYYGERIYRFIEKENTDTISSRIDSLFMDISEFSSGAIDDDMTLMIIGKK
ncbi:MAG: serine/threonine-protein phosphatase [Leptospiraceae bacterium]|nr:serine/threonine-protein phosphatase [Leptospiraceae bacterium]